MNERRRKEKRKVHGELICGKPNENAQLHGMQ